MAKPKGKESRDLAARNTYPVHHAGQEIVPWIPTEHVSEDIAAMTPQDKRLSELVPGGYAGSPVLRTNLDLSSDKGRTALTQLLAMSKSEVTMHVDKVYTFRGYVISEANRTDDRTGEVISWPRSVVLTDEAGPISFGGIVVLRSLMLLDQLYPPSVWASGLRVKVHGTKSRFGGIMHRFEVVDESADR